MCRSRRELSNEYLLAKIGVDTAENELLEVLVNIIKYYSFVSLLPGDNREGLRRHEPHGRRNLRRVRLAGRRDDASDTSVSQRASNLDAAAAVDDLPSGNRAVKD